MVLALSSHKEAFLGLFQALVLEKGITVLLGLRRECGVCPSDRSWWEVLQKSHSILQ